jgi:hypothetical protein
VLLKHINRHLSALKANAAQLQLTKPVGFHQVACLIAAAATE